MRFIFLCLFICTVTAAFGQEQGAYYEISNLYHERARTFSCEFIHSQIAEIKSKTDEQIKNELLQESEEIKVASQELAQAMKQSASHEPKKFYIKALESVCKGIRAPVQITTRGAGLANSAVINTLALPFGSLFSFLKGAFGNRNNQELGARTDFIYRVMGPKRGVPSYVLGMLAYQVPDLLFKANPAFAIVNASVAVEMITNYQCLHVNPADVKKVNFCQTYGDLKDFYHRGYQASFRSGKKLQALLDKRMIAKREASSPESYCALSKEKQIRRAKAAMARATGLKNDERIFHAEILLPIHKNNCTKILIQARDAAAVNELKKEKTHLEGIQIVYLLKKEYPAEFYFSQAELDQMKMDEQLCHDVERNNLLKVAQIKSEVLNTFFKASLAPSLLGTPDYHKIAVSDELVRKGQVNGLKNLIFTIGPGEENQEQIKALLAEKKSITKKVKAVYKKLMKSDDVVSCQQFVQKKKLDLLTLKADFQRLSEIASSDLIRKNQELEAVKKFYKKLRWRLKLNWELIATNNLNDISRALSSREVGNIIILSHGKSSGHLVDVLNQELPREAFTDISPTIMSLNFYSCYSHQLLKLYNLEEKISRNQSFYKLRYLTSVQENDFMNSSHFAPIAAFGDYLFQLDGHLSHSLKGAKLLQENFERELPLYQEQQVCRMSLGNMSIKKGSYAVTLNDKLLATVTKGQEEKFIEFSCDSLKQTANILRIKNIINTGGSEIENLETFEIEVEGKLLTSKDSTLRRNSFITFKFDL